MIRSGRCFLTVLLLASSLGLAACEPGDMIDKISDLIPSSKKPLPGERKEVFPQGVPGVAQGVPPELVRGYQAPPDAAAGASGAGMAAAGTSGPGMAAAGTTDVGGQAAAAETTTPQKPKPKKKVARVKPPSEPSQDQSAQPAPAAWPAPQGQATAPWPSSPQSAPKAWPQSQ